MSTARSGIGSHTLPNNGQGDTWLTPLPILSALGEFDLDPCAAPSPRPWPTAKRMIESPEDGLAVKWEGRVWLNPPYGRDIGRWMKKMALHCKWDHHTERQFHHGIALTFARTETEAWTKWIWPYAKAVLFIAGRLHFCRPDGIATKTNAGGPSALIAYSEWDIHVIENSGIAGTLVSTPTRNASCPHCLRGPLDSCI